MREGMDIGQGEIVGRRGDKVEAEMGVRMLSHL